MTDIVERLRWCAKGFGHDEITLSELDTAADEIERLWAQLAEVQSRLNSARLALTGISSCSTCDVCRNVALSTLKELS